VIREPSRVMLSICENIGVEFGVESGVSLTYGVTSGVEDEIDAVGLGVGEPLPVKSSRFPRVTISAITTPNKPSTKTIASIHGNRLRRGRSSADADAV
jgi:hypothetical protein